MPAEPEACDLLRAIAWAPEDVSLPQLALLAGKVRDWDALQRLAQEHRVTPMLYMRLSAVAASVPAQTLASLRAEYDRNMVRSLANAAELIDLLKAFDEKRVPAMPFKGVVLAASVYGDYTARPAGDIDFLIQYEDLNSATAILLDRGYELTTPLGPDGKQISKHNSEYHFERRLDGMVTELRWRLARTRNFGLNWALSRRRIAVVAGSEIPDLDPEATLIVLCLHGNNHLWSRLIWISDVARLLDSNPELDWKDVLQTGNRLGLWRMIALGVLLASRIAAARVPEAILRRFESDSTVSRVAQHFQQELFDNPGNEPAGFIPYRFQTLRIRDLFRLLFSGEFMKPDERDREVIRLPHSLHALYYLIRPFRILLQKSRRT
jgi:Uncharacterised nucleotidyltransferase